MNFALVDGKIYTTQDRFTFNVGMKVLNNEFGAHLSKHTFLIVSCRGATTGQPQGLRPYEVPADLDAEGNPGQPQRLRSYRQKIIARSAVQIRYSDLLL